MQRLIYSVELVDSVSIGYCKCCGNIVQGVIKSPLMVRKNYYDPQSALFRAYFGYLVMPCLKSQKHRQVKQKDAVNAAICTLT